MDLGLDGRTAIVSGASAGIGRAIARALAGEGANLALFARRRDLLEEAVAEFGADRAVAVAGDSTRPQDLERLVALAKERFGSLDIIVNNTGGPSGGAFSQLDDDDWRSGFELAVLSGVQLARLAIPDLRASGRGRIVSITGYLVHRTEPKLVLSSSLRRSVVGWTMALAREEARHGVTVNAIAPGYIDTERLRYLHSLSDDPEAARAGQIVAIPAGRFGTPQEVAALAAYLCSTHAAYITGETVLIDGGLLT